MAQGGPKSLGINLRKHVQNLYTESYKKHCYFQKIKIANYSSYYPRKTNFPPVLELRKLHRGKKLMTHVL